MLIKSITSRSWFIFRHTLTVVEPQSSRKRKINEKNIQKSRRQQGLEYVSIYNKKTVAAKTVKEETCSSAMCLLKCNSKISDLDRRSINSGFWGLNTARKNDFYARYVTRSEKQRSRSRLDQRKRLYSYKYYLGIRGETYQVCQSFFINTLHISKATIYYFFDKAII
jgi:hypothetical protein